MMSDTDDTGTNDDKVADRAQQIADLIKEGYKDMGDAIDELLDSWDHNAIATTYRAIGAVVALRETVMILESALRVAGWSESVIESIRARAGDTDNADALVEMLKKTKGQKPN